VGVDGRHLGLAVTEQGLRDRNILRDLVCPRAQTMAETVPTKTLTLPPTPKPKRLASRNRHSWSDPITSDAARGWSLGIQRIGRTYRNEQR
jgi:hypothetical protein